MKFWGLLLGDLTKPPGHGAGSPAPCLGDLIYFRCCFVVSSFWRMTEEKACLNLLISGGNAVLGGGKLFSLSQTNLLLVWNVLWVSYCSIWWLTVPGWP